MMVKKSEEKNFDSLMAVAMVKEDEQPHEIPANWVWTRITLLAEQVRGVSYKKKDAGNEPSDEKTLILRAGNIQNGEFVIESDRVYVNRDLVSNKQSLQLGDVIIVGSSGSKTVVGKAAQVLRVMQNISFGAFLTLFRPHGNVNKKYYGLFFQTKFYRDTISKLSSGININNIKREHFEAISFPLPPLPEQKRIVKKLESMLGKLKEARELIREARDTFEQRRAAILHKAFTGELTKKWREENPGLSKISENGNNHQNSSFPVKWTVVKSNNLFSFVTSGSRGWAKYYNDSGTIFIRITNLDYNSTGIDTAPNKIKKVKLPDKAEGKRTRVEHNDILISITGDVGMIAIVPEDFPEAYINQHIALARPINGIAVKYLAMFLTSEHDGRAQLKSMQRGATKAGLGLDDIKNVEVPLPPIEEQKEIVRILENILDHENEAEALIDLEEQIDLIEKSILSKAFRGRLSTNNPKDEPAIDLLKNVLSEREAVPKQARKKSPRVKSIEESKTMADILTVLRNAKDWIAAQEAFQQCGIGDGSDSDDIEKLYLELRDYVNDKRVEVERRGDQDWLRINSGMES